MVAPLWLLAGWRWQSMGGEMHVAEVGAVAGLTVVIVALLLGFWLLFGALGEEEGRDQDRGGRCRHGCSCDRAAAEER